MGGRRARVRRGGFDSQAEAERAGRRLRRMPGVEAVTGRWTVQRWLELWLAQCEARLRPTAVVNYRRIVQTYLIPQLGETRLTALRTRDVQRAIDAIARTRVRGGGRIAPSTVDRARAVLRSALNEARRQGLIENNPAWRVRVPGGIRPHPVVWDARLVEIWRRTGARPRVGVWDVPHLGRFLELVQNDPFFALWWLVAVTGLRRGEVVGLCWEDVDLDAGEIVIWRQAVVVRGRELIGPPKSAAGVRVVALDERTVQILRAFRHRNRRTAHLGGRVFRHADGRPVRPEWITWRFRQLVDSVDVPPVRFHDLRHAAASVAFAAGLELKVVQYRLGHSSIVTTAQIYVSVLRHHAHAAARVTAELVLKHARLRLKLGGASEA